MYAIEDPIEPGFQQNFIDAKSRKAHHASIQSPKGKSSGALNKPIGNSLSSPQNDQNPSLEPSANVKELKTVQEEEDFKNTWKKAPRVSKKLPPAFGAMFQKSAVSLQK